MDSLCKVRDTSKHIIQATNIICNDSSIILRNHSLLKFKISELIIIFLAFVNEKVSKVPIIYEKFSCVDNIHVRIPLMPYFLRMELNSVERIHMRFHSCHERVSMVIIAYRGRGKNGTQPFVRLEFLIEDPIMMSVVG